MQAVKQGLSSIWKAWKKFGALMGEIVGRVFLMLFYLTVALPFGLGVRLFGDPLDIRRKRQPAWLDRSSAEATVEAGHNQF